MNKGAVAVAILGLAASLPASAAVIGFSGAFAPAQWVTTGEPAFGSVSTSGAPGSITLNGGDLTGIGGCPGTSAGFDGPCQLSFTTFHVENPFSFHWAYHTDDVDGPGFDHFGVLLDGTAFQLSDNGGLIDQSRDERFLATTSFGFYLNCTDCTGGPATVTISAFQAPEPSSLAMLGLALAGIGALRGRRKGDAA